MIEGIIMRFLNGYIAQYLDNFDKSNISISLLKGKVSLSNLQLNNKILDNIPFPVKLKYGRIGSIKLEVPSFIHIQKSKITVEVSDIFLCLTMRPCNEWKDETIVREFQKAKQRTLDTYEEDATFFYFDQKGDEQGTNRTLLQIASNIHVSIKNVYLRIEDPEFPFALGVLIPQLEINSADKNWHPIEIVENPEIMFKSISLQDLTIFLERDKNLSSIDTILNIDTSALKNEKDKTFQSDLDNKIQTYLELIFSENNLIKSGILNKFCLDIRFQMILDAATLKKNDPTSNEPDLGLKIIFGGLFTDSKENCHFMDLKLREEQITALLQFSTFTSIFNSFRYGVLTRFYEREVNVQSPEIKDYVRLYESYQCYKLISDEAKMEEIKTRLTLIESKYRTDLLYWIRRVVNEKFYSLQKLEQEKQQDKEAKEGGGILGFFKWGISKGQDKSPEEEKEDNQDCYVNKKQEIKKKFSDSMKEIELFSMNQYNPFQVLSQSKEFTIEFTFQIPKLQLQLYSQRINNIFTTADHDPILKFIFEGLDIQFRQEARPEYAKVEISYSNFCLMDLYSPNKDLPYILQTVYVDDSLLSEKNGDKSLTIVYEKFPKDNKIAHGRLNLYTQAQLYVYINLSFGSNIMSMIIRVLKANNTNYMLFMSKIHSDIKDKIKEGSFYLQLINVLSETVDQVQNSLIQMGQGQMEKPKLDININFYSPKIILFEELFGEKLIEPNEKSVMVFDFGQLQGKSELISIDDLDANSVTDRKLIYDSLTFKFGKMQILMSYAPQIDQASNYFVQNWNLGVKKIQITNEFNFGLQVLTCDPVFHGRFPSTIMNFKIKEMSLFLSRKTWKTYFRFIPLYRYGSKKNCQLNEFIEFWKILGQYFGLETPQIIEEEPSEVVLETQAHNLSIPSIREERKESQIQQKLDQIQRTKSVVKQSVTIETNFIVNSLKIKLQEVRDHQNDDEFIQKNSDASNNPSFFTEVLIKNNDNINMFNGVTDLLELGIQSLKGRIISVTDQDTTGHIFLSKIYAKDVDAQSRAQFKHLIFNPFQDEEKGIEKTHSQYLSLDKRYAHHNSQPSNIEAATKQYWSQQVEDKSQVPLDFHDFSTFSPEQEDLSMNNQLVVKFRMHEETSDYDIHVQNLRMIFIIPLVELIIRFQIDLQNDIVEVEKRVKIFLQQGSLNLTSAQTMKRRSTLKQPDEVRNIVEEEKKADPFDKQKTKSPKKFIFKSNNLPIHKQGTSNFAKLAIQTKLLKHDPTNLDPAQLQELKNRTVTKQIKSKLIVNVNVSSFEVMFPTNIYTDQSMILKISTKSLITYISDTLTEEDYLKELGTVEETLKFKQCREMESQSKLNIDLQQLQMYVEEEGGEQEDDDQSKINEKIFFLQPYDLIINISNATKYIDPHKSISETYIKYTSQEMIQMSIGFKEFNSYLLLFQLYFQFSNEWADMQAEINPQLKEKINFAKNMNKIIDQKGGSASRDDLTIEEILVNENMLQKKNKYGDLWKKGYLVTSDQQQRKDFVILINDFDIKGMELVFTDNLGDFDQALLTVNIQKFSMYIESRSFDTVDIFKNERLFQEEHNQIENQIDLGYFFQFRSEWRTQCLYYNSMNFAQESLIEPFPFTIDISQEKPLSETTANYSSNKLMNINLTYGFVCSLSRAFKNIVVYEDKRARYEEFKEQEEQKEEELKELVLNEKFAKPSINFIGKNIFTSVSQNVKQNFKKKQLEAFVQQNKQTHKISQRYFLDNELSQVKKKIEVEQNENMDDTLFSINDITELVFLNCMGVNLKFCFNIFAKDMTSYKATKSKHVRKLKRKKTESDMNNHLILPIYEIDEFLREARMNNELMFYDKSRMCMKINFIIDGFQPVKNVSLQRNGIFGYYLFGEGHHNQYDQDRKAKSGLSCIVRIIRDRYTTYIHFESPLVVFNYTLMNLSLMSRDQGASEKQEHKIEEKKLLNAPFQWFKNKAALSIRGADSEHEQEVDLYQKITDVFDPRIINPYIDHSKCINIRGRFIAVDIFLLKTKTNVGQFLIIIQPIMKITNFLFTDIELLDPKQEEISFMHLKTKDSKYLYQVDPYAETQNDIKLRFRAEEFEYYESNVSFRKSKIQKNEDIGLKQGFIFTLTGEPRDQDKQRQIQVIFELNENTSALKDTEYDNFLLRQKIYSKQKSLCFNAYAPYMAVNQTKLTIHLASLPDNLILQPQSSVYFLPKKPKLKIKVEDYHLSDTFHINTFGMSGSIKLKLDHKDSTHPEIANDGSDLPKYIEIGTYIALCDHPYSRTKVIKFVPRYFIINRMELPIVMKEKKSNYQMALTLDDEVDFNFNCVDNLIQLRIINMEDETNINKLQLDDEHHRQRSGSVYRMISAKSSEHSAIKQDVRQSEENSRKEGEDDEVDENGGEELEIQLKQSYGETNERSIWSYQFSITDIDDFQITLPNLNKDNPIMKEKKSWSESGDYVFVRVTICTNSDHEGTMFVTFSKPYYPEYVFYNNTGLSFQIGHKSFKKSKQQVLVLPCLKEYRNDKFVIKSQEKRAIVLNPREKDEDILVMYDYKENGHLGHKFKYEIDSLKKQVSVPEGKVMIPQHSWSQFYICTKITGNLRFIHLMTLEHREAMKKQKQEIQDKQQDNVAFTMINPGKSSDPAQGNQDSIFYINRQAYYFKGIGISIVDFQPKELFYISLYSIRFKNYTVSDDGPQSFFFQKYLKKKGVEKTHQIMSLKLGNFQIDNMGVKSNAVIVGPKKPFNYRESNNLIAFIQLYLEQYMKNQGIKVGEESKKLDETIDYIALSEGIQDFLRIKVDQHFMIEGQISNHRIKLVDVKLQEINVLIHSSFLNSLSTLKASIDDLLSDEVVNPFMNSVLMANYNKMLQIWYFIDTDPLIQDGKGAERNRVLKRQQTTMNRAEYGKSLTRSAQPSYYKARTQMDQFKSKEEVCPFIRADQLDLPKDFILTASKVLISQIHIMAFRFYLTFRVSKLENKGGAQGFYYIILNFLSNFASISDAQMYFSEIDIKNAYKTIVQVENSLIAQYTKEGYHQFYQLLGSTDIIGNPAGLVNNLGRAVHELYSEPFQGIIERDARKAAIGFAKGLKGLASNSTVGITNSISKFSGTVFISMKNIQGIQYSESNLDNPPGVISGFVKGSIGLVNEIGQGVTGIVSVPMHRVRDQGVGCGQISKGTAQGLFGCVASPLTAVFKFVHSLTTGVKNFANEQKMENRRFRLPRYIDERDVIRDYNQNYSHAYAALQIIQEGVYKNETIVLAYDVSFIEGKKRKVFKDMVFICTEERILLVSELKDIKNEVRLGEIETVHMEGMDEIRNQKLVLVKKDGKSIQIFTQHGDVNEEIVKELNRKILKSHQPVVAQ